MYSKLLDRKILGGHLAVRLFCPEKSNLWKILLAPMFVFDFRTRLAKSFRIHCSRCGLKRRISTNVAHLE